MKNHTIIYLILGVLAAIVVGIGEYLLHFLPQGPGGEVKMLEQVPLSRASKGHFLAVLGAPLYIFGYYGLKQFFSETSPRLANLLFFLGIFAFSIGGVWISSRYFGAVVLQKSRGSEDYAFYLKAYETHYQILVRALRVIMLLISLTFIILVLKSKGVLPKWVAIFNPIVLLAIIISSLFWFKPLGVQIAPIAMNVTHFIFFGLILFYQNKLTKHEVV